MQAKAERFEMRLDPGLLERVDEWRAEQNDLPSRAEAFRRLVELGLRPARSKVAISDGEKLILGMLSDVYRHLKVKGDSDPDFLMSTLVGGHYWGLRWKCPGLIHDHEDSDAKVSEVVNFLDMWFFVESGYGKLTKQDKERVKVEAAPFGEGVAFRGFDGNNESEYLSIARYLIDDLERFSSFKKRDLNSHMPSVGAYRRMYRVFEPIRATLVGRELGASQIIELLNAMRHPESKK